MRRTDRPLPPNSSHTKHGSPGVLSALVVRVADLARTRISGAVLDPRGDQPPGEGAPGDLGVHHHELRLARPGVDGEELRRDDPVGVDVAGSTVRLYSSAARLMMRPDGRQLVGDRGAPEPVEVGVACRAATGSPSPAGTGDAVEGPQDPVQAGQDPQVPVGVAAVGRGERVDLQPAVDVADEALGRRRLLAGSALQASVLLRCLRSARSAEMVMTFVSWRGESVRR